MKNILIGLLLLLPLFAQARSYDWKLADINIPELEINDLRFTNRARCALDSGKPTDSAFVLVQNMEVAKGLYRLAKTTGNNSSDLTKMGIQVYRYAVVNLLKHIHTKLMRGDLPLLPVDTTGKYVPQKYAGISSICRSDEYCKDLDSYIEGIWNISRSTSDKSRKMSLYRAFDNFDLKRNLITNKVMKYKTPKYDLTCHYLKKFSPLQAHLYGVKPNEKVFEQLANANINRSEYLAECSDIEAQKDLKVAAYQIEIPGLNEYKWKKVGFDYWNSLKLYFSWAWRNSPEMKKMAAPFAEVLRGVALEESVMIVPNGCKSITPAKCDGDYLQLNVLREFAKKDYAKEALDTDILKPLPEGPQNGMINDVTPAVNTDILDMADFDSSEKWLENFRDNLSKTRGIMKRKLIKAVNFLNLATLKLTPAKINDLIDAKFERLGLQDNGEFVANTLDKEEEKDLKNELYYLCSEFIQANHDDFSFIKGDLEILRKTTLIDMLSNQITDKKTKTFYEFYETVAKSVSGKCNTLNQEQLWDGDFKLDKTGFSQWYVDKVYEGKVQSSAKEKIEKFLGNNTPLLSYKSYKGNVEDVICVNGSHCARKTLSAIIDLYAVAQYANTFWSMDQMVKTPSFFNPYAERTQCKVYDPWFKTKQIIFNLFTNLGQAAAAAFVPGTGIFASMELQPGRVVSMKQLIKEGKIEYDINRERASIFQGLSADLGPLIGVPCKISVSRHFDNPYNHVAFAGVTVGGCYNRDNGNLNVYSASDIEDPIATRINACASCTLNFQTVTSSLTAISNFVPYAGTALHLLDGLVRLYNGLQDPHNIPRKLKSNPNYVLDTYRKFGEVPKRCVRRLRKGKQCLKDWKEEKILKDMRSQLKHVSIKSFSRRTASPNASVMIHGCEKPIKVKLRLVKESELTVPAECNYLRKTSEIAPYENENLIPEVSGPNVVEAEKLAREIAARERAEREALERERLLRERAERIAREEAERARLAREEAERARLEREEAERLERARLESDRAERLERARLERERAERLERARLERERAERLERARLERERFERERAEARLERERTQRLERARLERERARLERAEAARLREAARITSYGPADIYIPALKRNDCMIYKNKKGDYILYLMNLKVRNVRATSEKTANWFIAGMDNHTPLYLARRGMSTAFINNKSVNLGKTFVPYLEIISETGGVKNKYVLTHKCQGFDEFEEAANI